MLHVRAQNTCTCTRMCVLKGFAQVAARRCSSTQHVYQNELDMVNDWHVAHCWWAMRIEGGGEGVSNDPAIQLSYFPSGILISAIVCWMGHGDADMKMSQFWDDFQDLISLQDIRVHDCTCTYGNINGQTSKINFGLADIISRLLCTDSR